MSANSTLTSACNHAAVVHYIKLTFFLSKLLLVTPLVALVLFLGVRRHRRRRQRQQQGRPPSPASHSDVFTYHVSVFELVNLFGYVLSYSGVFAGLYEMAAAAVIVLRLTLLVPVIFHIMACVDRYLAVICPISYMRLRVSAGRIQLISPLCAWLLSAALGVFSYLEEDYYRVLLHVLSVVSLVVISTFSTHMLCALRHAGPEGAGSGAREDQGRASRSKERAAQMVVTITGTLWMWFLALLLPVALRNSVLQSHHGGCLVVSVGFWFSLPTDLVLPLLYLRKVAKQK